MTADQPPRPELLEELEAALGDTTYVLHAVGRHPGPVEACAIERCRYNHELLARVAERPEGLDVELLRQALDLSGMGMVDGGTLPSAWAEAVAVEYRRALAADSRPEQQK